MRHSAEYYFFKIAVTRCLKSIVFFRKLGLFFSFMEIYSTPLIFEASIEKWERNPDICNNR